MVAPDWVTAAVTAAFAGTEEESELVEAAKVELEKYVVLVFVEADIGALEFIL